MPDLAAFSNWLPFYTPSSSRHVETRDSQLTIRPFIRWDEKAGLRRDAIRSQWSTRSKRNRKETGYEKD